jgi:hypothetical protein
MLHLIFIYWKGAYNMQDNLQTYAKMYCEGTEKLFAITLNENETYREALERSNAQWSYEILNDIAIFDDKRAITVRVYLTGEIRTGRYVYGKDEAGKAHYLAIEDALSQLPAFIRPHAQKPQEQPQTKPETIPVQAPPVEHTQQAPQALSQEEILNMVLQQQNTSTVQQNTSTNTPITTAEQLNNDTREEIPFEEFQLSEDELDKMLGGNAQAPVEDTSVPAPMPTAPVQQTPTSFTPEQIQRMNNFKQKFGVNTDADFGKYVNAWDKKYTSKRDITPANIESFLKYVEDLGEFPG